MHTTATAKLANGLKDRPNSSDMGGGSGTANARTHLVKSGETLWGLAKKYYGNGAQYQKIFQANTDILKDPNLIYVGQKLVIP